MAVERASSYKDSNTSSIVVSPKVSVAMGVYNPKRELLLQSVSSIISQTFEDWELIICDDGSVTADARVVLDEVASLDPRIRVVGYRSNKGLANALDVCIAAARGSYVARQDDDDRSAPERFQRQVAYLDEHPACAFVGSTATVFDNQGAWGAYPLEEDPTPESFLWNSPFIHPSVMFRRDALESVDGYRVAPETDRCEDYDLFMRLYALGYRGHNLQDALYDYRIDRDAKKYRPMSARMNEAKVRASGFKALGLGARRVPYVIKPIVLGLLPGRVMRLIRRNRY